MKALFTLGLLLLGCSGSSDPGATNMCPDGAVTSSSCQPAGTGGSSASGGQTGQATGGSVATGGATASGGATDGGTACGPGLVDCGGICTAPSACTSGTGGSGGSTATGGQPGTGGTPQCGAGQLYCGGSCKTCPTEPNPTGVEQYCASGTCQIRCVAPYTSASYGFCQTTDTMYAGCCTGYISGTTQIRTICGCQ